MAWDGMKTVDIYGVKITPHECHSCGHVSRAQKMSARQVSGDDFEGTARVLNSQSTHLKFDDLVRYRGGKPRLDPWGEESDWAIDALFDGEPGDLQQRSLWEKK